MSLDHADRAVHPEGDVAEQGAGQRPVPLLIGGQVQTPEGRLHHSIRAAAVELRVGEGHGAEGMASLEAENSLTVLLRAGGQVLCCFKVLEILTHKQRKDMSFCLDEAPRTAETNHLKAQVWIGNEVFDSCHCLKISILTGHI